MQNPTVPFGLAFLLALPIALGNLAHAQTETSAAEAEPDLYQVELIFFRNLDQSGNTPEIPRLPEPGLDEQLDTELARLSDQSAAPERMEWLEIPAGDRVLAGTARSIAQLQAYELLYYVSWGQPAPDVAVAVPVTLAELGVNPAVLSGEVELHQRRYLHLELDVALADGTQPAAASAEMDMQLPAGTPPLPAIRDSRRIRLTKLHYFDAPSFGVIAVVTRLKQDTTEAG